MDIILTIEEREGVTPEFLHWKFKCTPNNISMHLAKLRELGWITYEQYGKHRIYNVTETGKTAIIVIKARLVEIEAENLKRSKKINEKYDSLLDKEKQEMEASKE